MKLSEGTGSLDRELIHEFLRQHDQELAELYAGAVKLLDCPEAPGKARLVTHAMREITNGLPRAIAGEAYRGRVEYADICASLVGMWDRNVPAPWCLGPSAVLAPPDEEFSSTQELGLALRDLLLQHSAGHLRNRDRARAMFRALAPGGDALADRMDLAQHWLDLNKWFQSHAHVGNEISTNRLLTIVGIFESMLLALASPFFETADRIDAQLASGPPEMARALQGLLAHPQHFRYFFNRIQDRRWLAPLYSAGFFSKPPPSTRSAEEGVVRLPDWPPLVYLSRMAEDAEARPQVLEILLKLDPDNDRIRADLLDLAVKFKATNLRKLAKRALKWVDGDLHLMLPRALGEFSAHLAEGGETALAIRILQSLLRIRRPAPSAMRTDPQPRIDLGRYRSILSDIVVERVSAHAPMPALEFLVSLEKRTLRLAARGKSGRADDTSFLWMPSLSDDSHLEHQSISSALAVAVRRVAERAASYGPRQAGYVVQLLRAQQAILFTRVALHIARLYCDRDTHRALILDTDLWHNAPAARLELQELLRDKAATLAATDQALILEQIQRGKEGSGEGYEPHEWAATQERWKRDHLSLVRGILTQKLQDQLHTLERKHGPARKPQDQRQAHGGAVWVGPMSPLDTEELGAMVPTDIAAFLREWMPREDRYEFDEEGELRAHPSAEGLSRSLEEAASNRAAAFAACADVFVGCDAPYVSAVLRGIMRGTSLDFSPMRRLVAAARSLAC